MLRATAAGTFDAPMKIATLPLSSCGLSPSWWQAISMATAILDLPCCQAQETLSRSFGPRRWHLCGACQHRRRPALSRRPGDGDFNNDDEPTFCRRHTSVAILLGKVQWHLRQAAWYQDRSDCHAGSLAIALGDVNGDSHLDVAVTDQNGNLQILLGSASGALHPQMVSALFDEFPTSVNVIAIADFNGDGKLDIAAGNGGFPLQYTYPGYASLMETEMAPLLPRRGATK